MTQVDFRKLGIYQIALIAFFGAEKFINVFLDVEVVQRFEPAAAVICKKGFPVKKQKKREYKTKD